MFISSGSTQLRGFTRPGSFISSHFLPRLLELERFFLTHSVVARLTVCIYIEILQYCMPYHEVANLVSVTNTNMIDEMPCAYGTLRTTALRIWHQVSRRAAPKFDYPNSQISSRPECTSITAGAFRSIWECSCRVWGTNGETAIGGRCATRRVVLTPGAE